MEFVWNKKFIEVGWKMWNTHNYIPLPVPEIIKILNYFQQATPVLQCLKIIFNSKLNDLNIFNKN